MPIASDGAGNFLTLGADGAWAPATVAQHPETGAKLILDGTEWKPLPGSEPTKTGSALRGVVRGATFGFNDEMRAGTDALVQGAGNLIHGSDGRPTMGQAYDTSLATNRAADRQDYATNPVSSIAGDVAGGVGGALLASRALGPGAVIAGASRFLPTIVNQLGPRIPAAVGTTARYVGGGAAAGGLAGFGSGEGGLGNRAEGAAVGGAVGGVVAPVLGAAATAAPAIVGRVGHALNLRDPQIAADRHIVRSLDRGGVSVDQAENRLAAAGDAPVALVDVGGRNTVNLAGTAANTPGKAMEAADNFVQQRRLGRPDRLMNEGDAAFGGGSGTDVADATGALRAQRSTEAPPLYAEAFGKPAGMTDSMGHILNDPVGQAGLRRGLEIQRIENATRRARGEPEVPTTDPAIRFDDNGDPRIVGVPNMRSLDAVKRGMDATIEDARNATTGKVQWTERLHAIDDMRRTWVGMLDENNPQYAAVRAAWGGPSAQMEATQAGRTALRTDRDVVAARATQGPQDVQDAYRLGAGRDFADRVSDPATASGAARKLLEDHQMQGRLNSLLPPGLRDQFNAALRRETEMTAVERSVSPRAGSPTSRLTAGGADMGRDVSGPWLTAMRQLTSGHPIQALATASTDVAVRRLGQGINSSTSDALANRLFENNPVLRQRVTEALRNRLALDETATARARAVIRPVARGIAETAGGRAARD